MKRLVQALAVTASVVALAPAAMAQDKAAGQIAEIKQHTAAAHQIAGRDFAWMANMMCLNAEYGGELIGYFYAGQRMSDVDQDFEPTQIFDGVYYVGLREIGAYAIKTSAGVILVDSLLPGQTETYLIPHLAKVGIKPQDVKYLITTHAHTDHMGGAKYFQDKYKTKLVMTAQDWEGAVKTEGGPAKDVVVADGDKVTLGDKSVTIVFAPGHTPGALSVVMDVKDKGTPHKVFLMGGAGWGLAAMPPPMRPIYTNSLNQIEQVMQQNKVDVVLDGHAFLTNSLLKIAQVRQLKAGAPNPLVIGEEGAKKWITIMKECHAASNARYQWLSDKFGADPRQWPRQIVQ